MPELARAEIWRVTMSEKTKPTSNCRGRGYPYPPIVHSNWDRQIDNLG